uniref:Ig-like domain-containing protein n=1 Tax=Steinernema glaseri TaxID=37863 RepID=A0A1I7XZK3_9BILA
MLLLAFVVLPLTVHLGSAGICNSTCHSYECEIWLESDYSRDKSGVYPLSENAVEISCSFLSLAKSVDIEWQFKGRRDREWKTAECNEFSILTEKCEVNDNFEHNFTKTCNVQLDDLSNSGIFRCKAVNEHGKSAVSAETTIHVHGIGTPRVVESDLPFGQPGFVEAEVCANPLPRVYWSSRNYIVGDSESQGPYAVSALKHDRPDRSYSADYSSYCYRSRLIVARVTKDEAHLSLTVTTDSDYKQMGLPLHVQSLRRNGAPTVASCFFAFFVLLRLWL